MSYILVDAVSPLLNTWFNEGSALNHYTMILESHEANTLEALSLSKVTEIMGVKLFDTDTNRLFESDGATLLKLYKKGKLLGVDHDESNTTITTISMGGYLLSTLLDIVDMKPREQSHKVIVMDSDMWRTLYLAIPVDVKNPLFFHVLSHMELSTFTSVRPYKTFIGSYLLYLLLYAPKVARKVLLEEKDSLYKIWTIPQIAPDTDITRRGFITLRVSDKERFKALLAQVSLLEG